MYSYIYLVVVKPRLRRVSMRVNPSLMYTHIYTDRYTAIYILWLLNLGSAVSLCGLPLALYIHIYIQIDIQICLSYGC